MNVVDAGDRMLVIWGGLCAGVIGGALYHVVCDLLSWRRRRLRAARIKAWRDRQPKEQGGPFREGAIVVSHSTGRYTVVGGNDGAGPSAGAGGSFSVVGRTKGTSSRGPLGLVVFVLFSLSALSYTAGCAALTDPAHHGTAFMRAHWAKAAPCVAMCDYLFPNEMVLAVRVGDTCACKTDRNPPMGASYYWGDSAPPRQDQYVKVRLPTMAEAVDGILESTRKIVAAPCPDR